MGKVEVVKTRRRHLVELENNLRKDDLAEIRELGISPRESLWRCFEASSYNRTVLVDGKVGAIGGLAGSTLVGKADLWLFSSPEIEKIPIAYFKIARDEKENALQMFSSVEGWVSARYLRAINFLTHLGFDVIPNGTFCKFEVRA